MATKPPTLDGIRADIAAIESALAKLRRTPRARSEVIADARAHVERETRAVLHEMGERMYGAAVRNAPIAFALQVRPRNAGPADVQVVDMAGILGAVLGIDPVVEALAATAARLPEGIDADQRKAEEGRLRGELVRLGHVEEDIIEAREAAGETMLRRATALPEVVLRVRA